MLTAYLVSLLVKMGTYGADKNLTTILNSEQRRLQKVYYKDWKIDLTILFADKSNGYQAYTID